MNIKPAAALRKNYSKIFSLCKTTKELVLLMPFQRKRMSRLHCFFLLNLTFQKSYVAGALESSI